MVWNDLTSCQTTRCTCTHSQTPSASFSTRAAASRIESGSRWLKTPRNQDASNPVTSSSNPRLAIRVNAGVVLESGFHCKYYVHAQHVQLHDAYFIDVTIMLFPHARYWPGAGIRCQRLSLHHRHAREDEHGESTRALCLFEQLL